MKLRLPHALLALILFCLVSCSKELSKENGKFSQNGNFYATIDNIQWTADSLQLLLASSDGLSINGLSKSGSQISIILDSFKVGTFTLNNLSTSYALYANLLDDISKVYISNVGAAGGTVTISAIDTVNHVLSGTFELTLINPSDNSTVTITTGVLASVPYNGSSGGGVVTTGKDTLNATIDGNAFTGAQVVIQNPTVDQLLIAGIAASGTEYLTLIMPSNITPGTYNLDFTTGSYIGIYNPDPTTSLVSDANGTLTITSIDPATKRIKGTFSFIGSPFTSGVTAAVTNGYFSVIYQ